MDKVQPRQDDHQGWAEEGGHGDDGHGPGADVALQRELPPGHVAARRVEGRGVQVEGRVAVVELGVRGGEAGDGGGVVGPVRILMMNKMEKLN